MEGQPSNNETYITESTSVSLRSGEGLVGRVFASKGEQLVQNASELPANQFACWAMATEFGIVSLAAVFWQWRVGR